MYDSCLLAINSDVRAYREAVVALDSSLISYKLYMLLITAR